MEKNLLEFIIIFIKLMYEENNKSEESEKDLKRLYAIKVFSDYLNNTGEKDLWYELREIYYKYLYKNKKYIESIKDIKY